MIADASLMGQREPAALKARYQALVMVKIFGSRKVSCKRLLAAFPDQLDLSCRMLKELTLLAREPSGGSAPWQDIYGAALFLTAETLVLKAARQVSRRRRLMEQARASLMALSAEALGTEQAQMRAIEALWLLSGAATWAHESGEPETLDRAVAALWQDLPRAGLEEDAAQVLHRYGLEPGRTGRVHQEMAREIAGLDAENDDLRAALEGEMEAASCFL